jgi:regulatory protein
VDYLQELGLIDDREFARVFTGELVRKELGVYRVRGELLKKRLDRELVEEVLEEVYPFSQETERARSAAVRRVEMLDWNDPAPSMRKLIDYLVRRGFSRQVAQAASRSSRDQVDTQSGPELE